MSEPATVPVQMFGRDCQVDAAYWARHLRALAASEAAYQAWGEVRTDCDHRGATRAASIAYNRSFAAEVTAAILSGSAP